ncbi:uncharacterized protein LACBIDRAFT_305441 [Laccaria bicolor S238N-H82]|uniref:Predicted protein n=1 Tax=Laccaria bicolor (strain S238N-H82 / ATCC MYA-4686) TaxID=486041 RepID=B0CU86_LACBS|nr:uncharacterized protein LACBIDRAFT_305441 [Laccaria bicolor S238N-H82]EDR14624.1 predicted protein [Laccaria bicolor S238N-H82]|eukprot:XP_001875183.1 predicted protein [Laccaria bicolor S238N-H82]
MECDAPRIYLRPPATKLDYLVSIASSIWRLGTDLGRHLLFKLGCIAPPAFISLLLILGCIAPPAAFISFECGICLEEHEVRKGVMISNCEHPFCQDCLLGHVKTKLTESQYPIRCPTCSTERGRLDTGTVDRRTIEQLPISEHDIDKFEELQILVHSVKLTCPKCNETMFVLRSDYFDQKVITCPVPKCRHRFCKTCGKRLGIWAANWHACTDDAKLDRLVRKYGWRYCPGCHIPIQKESGCNHMTCVGCYMHFCYRCGEAIGSSLGGQDVGRAVTTHYSSCVQFEPFPRHVRSCTIQ